MSNETAAQERLNSMIRKVEGLLKKAQRTENSEEADAFFAKAQEMMTKHGIEEAMLALGKEEVPAEEVIHSDMPINRSGFFNSMVILARACGDANGCQVLVKLPASWRTEAGVRFIGFESDITKAKMLYTALLAHCVRERKNVPQYVRDIEMVKKGYIGRWRRDFSEGYGNRIWTRLMEIKRAEERAADVASGGSLLPALVDRAQLVKDYAASMSGKPRRSRTQTRMSDATDAGHRSANRADLGQTRVGGNRRAIDS